MVELYKNRGRLYEQAPKDSNYEPGEGADQSVVDKARWNNVRMSRAWNIANKRVVARDTAVAESDPSSDKGLKLLVSPLWYNKRDSIPQSVPHPLPF